MRGVIAIIFTGWCVLMLLAQCADMEREDAEDSDRADTALAAWTHLQHQHGRHP